MKFLFEFLIITLCCSILLTQTESSPAIFNGDEWVLIDSSSSEQSLPSPKTYPNQVSNAQIFIAIASFRDNRCSVTLKNLFSKAKNPERINIGLVEQIHTEEDKSDCIAAYCQLMQANGKGEGNKCPYRDQINVVTLSYLDSRGPAFARALQSEVMQAEEFCMQVDSHSDVTQDWDTDMISMWKSVGNEYGILSTVPADVSSLGKNVHGHFEVPHVCQATFNDKGMVRHLQPRSAMSLDKPILAPYWSAGFSFSKCHAEAKTPYDPNYLYIFDGEEFAKYARLWTRGYDVYTPNRVLVAHDYSGQLMQGAPSVVPENADPTDWVRNGMKDTYRWESFDASMRRIRTLLGMEGGDKKATQVAYLTKYGLGMKRSLDQFIEFTGMDTRTQTAFGDRCRQLEWVPFTPDSNAEVDSTDVWGFNPEIIKANGPNIPLLTGSIEYKAFNAAQSAGLSSGSSLHGIQNLNGALSRARIEESIKVAEGELWWVFQSVDRAVESVILQVDNEIGDGHGHRVLKLILLLAPLLAFVLYTAVVVMASPSRPIRGDAKRI